MRAFLTRLFWLSRKELQLESRHRLNLLHRLLVGPAVSAGTVAVIYHGLFRDSGRATLGPLSAGSIDAHLALGFLAHACLNAGYYALSEKMRNEWIGRTLALYWLAPGRRLATGLGMLAPEAMRLSLLAAIVLGAGIYTERMDVTTALRAACGLALVLLMGMGLGALRCCAWLLNAGKAEALDYAYLALVFTGCLYFPRSVLPAWLASVADGNPIQHAMLAMRGASSGGEAWAFAAAGALSALLAAAIVVKKGEKLLAERS